MTTHVSRAVVVTLVVMGAVAAPALAQKQEKVAGLPADEAMRLGERMYREGILPSGEPMMALVSEDIEVDGRMFSCQSCHLRSGRGSLEGGVITLPTCGSWLYKPLVGREMKPETQSRVPTYFDPPPFRKAYTDQLVARAIWVGKDPNDRELSWVMPRYKLSIRDMEILVHYLKNLSATFSPGVDDTTIRFATVVSHDVGAEDRDAMVKALEVHIRDHNSQVRHEERRAQHSPWEMEEMYAAYRRYSLAVWELTGPRETWPAQLEDVYNEAPVFALLGGMTTGDWSPIHEFCERNRIPCLLPITDDPVISDSDWYTLYFDKGSYQEGETAARFLHRSDRVADTVPVVQVFRDTPRGRDFARGFHEARAAMGLLAPTNHVLAPDQTADAEFWERLVADQPGAVLALWLGIDDLGKIGTLAELDPRPPMVFVSFELLGESASALPANVRSFAYLTHPHSFPEDKARTRRAVESWLKVKGLSVTNFDIQAKTYFIGWMLSGVVMMMRDDFYRDYFFDEADMMRDQYHAIAVYPRLSFGSGQRYASKGCYVVQLDDSDPPKLVKRSDWVIH
ncbi:MAG: amino acid ABC transporter substrate-binding protein [Holophagae bacterium]|nr:MAG: amino acid ABC transporter substrate-binding protein [Holophagae bacterium]